ncbi:MAG: DMT family transporter [Desulfobulbaceae bacterium]|nr:DMT family transporter [Desulfobulbaceae bacterium]
MLSTYRKHQPIFQVLLGAFMISFSAVFVKLAQVSPTTSGFYRVFFGSIFLLLCTGYQRQITRLSAVQIFLVILCGLAFALDLFFWHESIMYIGPGLATLLSNFQVFLLTAAGFIFLGEKLKPRFLAAIPLAVIGLLLIVGFQWGSLDTNYKTGIYFGLLTAVCYAIFLLSMRKIQMQNAHSHFFLLLLVSVVSSIFLGLKMIHAGDSFAIPDSTTLMSLLGLGLFSQTIGWVFIATAMPKIRASLTGLVLLLQPTLSFLWDVTFFSRPTDALNWIGVLLTLSAIYMGLTGQGNKR